MSVRGWNTRYSEIIKEFKYNKKNDLRSALKLNSLLKRRFSINHLKKLIENKPVFVIGAGPTLTASLPILKKYKGITTIVSDGASRAFLENRIRPDIIITDLDGHIPTLKKFGKTNTIFIVHAHGDNIEKLNLVSNFKNCLGTTQTKPIRKIVNFGGFTDGDRGVFLAHHFNAEKIILFGMDFGTKIGKYSKSKIMDKKTKIKKLNYAKKLLVWLASKNSNFYTTSKNITGFKKIQYKDLKNLLGH